MSKKKLTNVELLELYAMALRNVETQNEIKEIMADLGYDEVVIQEGKDILSRTKEAYDFMNTEEDETSEAYEVFSRKKEQLNTVYTLHRKKAKVIFRNEPLILEKLGLSHAIGRSYSKWITQVKEFYNKVAQDTELQTRLERLKITAEDITNTAALLTDVETAKFDYHQEKGESQSATKAKDEAFDTLNDWMSEFYAVARIGLEENPQLLESIGKFVRS
ncbi:hypothetical protein [Aureivirga sp. CE67]|uniref:hypothetical protein n=1 Tax=Aureivirga sp. CE67 TaxID=1788983 RepID=UPI0018CAC562|nr:hypothetical protein [Aureivirga sp. CE67]